MTPLDIIRKYYEPDSKAYYYLIHHSRLVARKALEIAENVGHLNPDKKFIEEAAMLHDIGIFLTDAPKLGCYGYRDYLCHGFLGRDLLDREGMPEHALVCERHVGVGITAEDVRNNSLPLPERDMVPLSVEEKIICFSDKFYSKIERNMEHEKPLGEVRKIIIKYGEEKLRMFDEWVKVFAQKQSNGFR
ncbi:MAG TPA: HD domain-containing protein [Thermodesulfovibrionales bacterium]|nr:HD domain-containing protein [Thermodesulfovibrionales bacterium]